MTRLRIGMVGGGRDAFIGAVHRMAAALDGRFELVAGALSATPEKAIASARDLGLAEGRGYGSWQEMLEAESARPPGERIDAVAIVTPNDVHAEVARAFCAAGIHVVCDKPMTTTLADAEALVEAADRAGVVFCVTYNYTGYPMVREARALVADGALGAIRRVHVEYHQGWLATRLEATGQKQAAWRTDPARAGAGAVGDIGSHAENLVATVTGLEIEQLCAEVSTFVPGRPIDDDASVLIRYAGGAKGVLTASQICVGEENRLTLRVWGERGGLAWDQERPNVLHVQRDGESRRLATRGGPGARSRAAAAATRIPAGHPEGFVEAFANLYRGVADAIEARRAGRPPEDLAAELPDVRDGLRGVRFITRVLESEGRWIDF